MSGKLTASLLLAAFIACFAGFGLSACESTGKATGKTVQEVKEMPGEFQKGYEEGKKDAQQDD